MALITKQDTNGIKGLLAKGELGLDDTGLDAGRVYVGDGTNNVPMAKKSDLDTKADISANLSDLTDAKDARQNLGLGTAATRDVGTSNDQVPEFVSNGEGLGGFGYGRVGTSEGKYTDVNDVPKRTGFYLLTEGHPNSTNNKAPLAGFYDTAILRTLRQSTNDFVDVYLPYHQYSNGMVIAPHTSNGYETQRIVSDSVNLRTTTGNSTIYPMNQKAVTDALNTKVSLTDNQTIEGIKTFASFPVTPSAAPTADYQVVNKKYVDDSVLANQLWGNRAIGEEVWLDDSNPAVGVPPTDNPNFRYIKLTAGENGSGGYNEGILINETVSGSAPLIEATAEVNLPDSPFHGQTVRLLNTERRFVRAGGSGELQEGQVEKHSHTLPQLQATDGGSGTTRMGGIASTNRFTGTYGGDETRPRNIGRNIYMRIL